MIRIIPLFFILLYGCAHLTASDPLYNSYFEYKKTVGESKIIKYYARYFAPVLTNNLDINDPSIKSQLEFVKYMAKEASHYEVTQTNKGCLTVNGVGVDNTAVAFYIQYNNINGKWLISDIDVSFLEKNQKYEQKALCPEQTRVQ